MYLPFIFIIVSWFCSLSIYILAIIPVFFWCQSVCTIFLFISNFKTYYLPFIFIIVSRFFSLSILYTMELYFLAIIPVFFGVNQCALSFYLFQISKHCICHLFSLLLVGFAVIQYYTQWNYTF